jgi:DNA-directed RNA polymerase subunit M/transcription elongation factor TFIIS
MFTISQECRNIAKKSLKTVITVDKNIDIIEKNIYKNVINSADKSDSDIESIYKENIYQIIGDFVSKKNIKDILQTIKDNKIGWEHGCFEKIKFRQNEQDEFVINPFEVEEGALECKKCGSKRTFSYSKQVRSCDEPMTTFAQCISCKAKWTN